jgi:hypothetical protein
MQQRKIIGIQVVAKFAGSENPVLKSIGAMDRSFKTVDFLTEKRAREH